MPYANIFQQRECCRKSYHKHKAQYAEYRRQYRKDHRDEIIEYHREYHKQHKDEELAWQREYDIKRYWENPEKQRKRKRDLYLRKKIFGMFKK